MSDLTVAKIRYGTGAIESELGSDRVTVGSLELKRQVFGQVVTTRGRVFLSSRADGIIGLALPKMSVSGSLTFFDSLIFKDILDPTQFSFAISRGKSSGSLVFVGAHICSP